MIGGDKEKMYEKELEWLKNIQYEQVTKSERGKIEDLKCEFENSQFDSTAQTKEDAEIIIEALEICNRLLR